MTEPHSISVVIIHCKVGDHPTVCVIFDGGVAHPLNQFFFFVGQFVDFFFFFYCGVGWGVSGVFCGMWRRFVGGKLFDSSGRAPLT